jgi:hypothetical protein
MCTRTAAYQDQQQTKEHVDIGQFRSGDIPKRIMQGLGLVVGQNWNIGTLFSSEFLIIWSLNWSGVAFIITFLHLDKG